MSPRQGLAGHTRIYCFLTRVPGCPALPWSQRAMEELREVVCRWEGCRQVFWLCSYCDYGQCYCSDRCREAGRSHSLRRARRKYARSGRGVENNRERQRRYRRRALLRKGNGSPFTREEKSVELEGCPCLAGPHGIAIDDGVAASRGPGEMPECKEPAVMVDGRSEQCTSSGVPYSPAPEGQAAEIRYCHRCGRPGRVARKVTLRGRFRWA